MITVLEYDEIFNILKNIPNGRFIRIEYKTNLPVKAEHKKAGWRVVKVTDKTARTGVSYQAILDESKKEANANSDEKKEPVFEWILKDKLCRRKSNGKDYVYLTSAKNANVKTQYKVVYPDGHSVVTESLDDYKYLIIDSYFSKTPTTNKADVYTIGIENVIRINDLGGDYIG